MYATVEEVKARSSFEEVTALTVEKIEGYIARAERWIHRATKQKFHDETDEYILADLKTATIGLVDYLWFWDNPDLKEARLANLKSEKIGRSYTYQIGEQGLPDWKTGIPELDGILDDLKLDIVGVNFFSVSGPTREAKRREQT